MTDIATSRSPSGGQETTTWKAKEEARDVGQTAAAAGGDVARTAKEQSKEVARETARQARDLYGEARGHLRDQAGAQQRRAAGGIRALGDELRGMAENNGGSGPAGELARQASGRIAQVADWIEAREPGQLVDEVKEFARRRPGTFLAGAAVLGVLAGRLTRGLVADAHDQGGTAADGRDADPAAGRPAREPAQPAVREPGVATANYPAVADIEPDSTVYAASTVEPAPPAVPVPPAPPAQATQPAPPVPPAQAAQPVPPAPPARAAQPVPPARPVERGPWDSGTRP